MNSFRIIFFILVYMVLPDFIAYCQHVHGEVSQEERVRQMGASYGKYPAQRDSSGTSWVPDSSPINALMWQSAQWDFMFEGHAFGIYDNQGGKRGDSKFFSENMFMFMGQRQFSNSTAGFRLMLSLEPLMGKRGYPLLFQTGETADGVTPLIDRQHPHDLFDEIAFTYSFSPSEKNSFFIYAGPVGEPALGPPVFMHRFSGMDNPEAPLGHHWLDSTHITYGVVTLGYVQDIFKFETSVFRGREPDQERWGVETPGFDSYSGRISFNPIKDLSFQTSFGYLRSPEQLEQGIDVRRTTASVIHNKNFGDGNIQTTFAWGRNEKISLKPLDAFLLESAINIRQKHTVFGRFEHIRKDELFEDEELSHNVYAVNKLSLGYIYDLPARNNLHCGIGSSFALHFIPSSLKESYGDLPVSYFLFLRFRT